MHSRFFSAVFLASCVAHGILAAPSPLTITHAPVTSVNGTPDQDETDNLARLKTTETDANRHILKMEHVLNNPTAPGNTEMIHAAFGKNAQVDEIKKTVQTIKKGSLPVTLKTDPDPHLLAAVRYDGSTHPATSGSTHFGKDFHDSKGTDNMRAATLVHEATHKLANTGDTVDHSSKMIAGDDFRTAESGRTGYASHIEPATTVDQLNKDKKWTDKRDGNAQHPAIKDLHNNAESYAQFGSMCDTAISNQAVGLRRRAMEERDWETAAVYLIRRAACAMRKKETVNPATKKTIKLSPSAKAKLSAISKLTAKKNTGTLPKSRLPVTTSRSKSLASKKFTATSKKPSALKKTVTSQKKLSPSSRKTLQSKVTGSKLPKKRIGAGSTSFKTKKVSGTRKTAQLGGTSKSRSKGTPPKAPVKGSAKKLRSATAKSKSFARPSAQKAFQKPQTVSKTAARKQPVALKKLVKKVRRDFDFQS